MMKKNFLLGFLLLSILPSCGNKKNTNETHSGNDTLNTTVQENKPQVKNYHGKVMDKEDYPGDLFILLPNEVRSSGALKGKNENYDEAFMIDHDAFTWWTPDPNRDGNGAWIQLDFDMEVPVKGFEVWGGSHNPDYPGYGDIYKLNNRVKKGTCEFSDGEIITFELNDVDNWQLVLFDSVIYTTSIKLRINEVYKGEKWNDLCIAEFLALTNDYDAGTVVSDEEGMDVAKPVIYLYPEKKTTINVQLDKTQMEGSLDVSYPDYGNKGWTVTATPDGKLTDETTGKFYNYLFWEGTTHKKWSAEDGFCVKGTETAAFLEEKLSYMGLLPNEYNDFIVYWLPLMQKNKYNLVRFANEEYNKAFPLVINPKPESVLRIYMLFTPVDSPVNVSKQKLIPFERKGFTVIEWGGSEVRNVSPNI